MHTKFWYENLKGEDYVEDIGVGGKLILERTLEEYGIPQWYSAGLGAGCSGFRILAEAGNFSLHHHVQTGSGAHRASYPMGTRGSLPGGKAARG
jgi:hypothetical protein